MRDSIKMQLERLTYEEILEVNKLCIKLARNLQGKRINRKIQKFSVGDRVSFIYKNRRMFATVRKINQKTVQVETDEPQMYFNVSPLRLEEATL